MPCQRLKHFIQNSIKLYFIFVKIMFNFDFWFFANLLLYIDFFITKKSKFDYFVLTVDFLL